jgi:hypothetical protein
MQTLARWWGGIQECLFPMLERCLAELLTEQHKRLAAVLDLVRIEEHVPAPLHGREGRPPCSRQVIARAFVAKAVFNVPNTEALIDRLKADANLRLICGFRERGRVPSPTTFSRAFAEFAQSRLADRVHEALVETHLKDTLVGHVSRDATDIVAREKPAKTAKPQASEPRAKAGKGRRRKRGPKVPSRLPKQVGQTAQAAISELPTACDKACKRNSKGQFMTWTGYKLHLDVNDAGLPLLALTTSASLHDSQAAIPMAKITASRVTALYEVMDSAYAAEHIRDVCRSLGHVPIIDPHPAQRKSKPLDPAEARRLNERTAVERAYSRLKDEFGARSVRVRGHAKVHSHLMFGVLALFADAAMKLVT